MLTDIQLAELAPSPTNPRKTFDAAKLEELAASIRDKGVLEPLLVRPRRASPPWTKNANAKYEVVAGERRYRAAMIAGAETVPCIVRELTDVEALEVQTIENLQRDDLHPLEEADGFAALMKEAGYDVAGIAQRIGKGEAYVYDRMKLLQLIPALKEVFLAGEITVGHAILLARLKSSDQERLLGSSSGSSYQVDSLFMYERGEDDPNLELDLDEDLEHRKPISVRELRKLINDRVRFDPAEEDLEHLFPETQVALATAAEEELKVIKITRDHQLRPETRGEGERTYSKRSWKRADGQVEPSDYTDKPSKTCEHSVMGVVVAGPGRSEAFHVCIAKKKCKVHWGGEMKAAKRRAEGASSSASEDSWKEQERKREEQWKKEREEQDRWKKAAPILQKALAEKLNGLPAIELADVVLSDVRPHGMPKTPAGMGEPKTVDDVLRIAAFFCLSRVTTNTWNAPKEAPKALKKYGVDAKKIVDQVAPKPKAEKKAKAKKKAPAKGKKRTPRKKASA